MSHPRKKSVAVPAPSDQTQILFAEHPGRTGVLVSQGKTQTMTFAGAHAALDWCESHRVTFCYIPQARVISNQ